MLELALNGMDLKLRYKNGPFNFQELGVLTASDASFAGEPNSRSQQGRIRFLVPAQQLLNPECCEYDVMIVSFSSTTIKRVCRQLSKQRHTLCKMPKRRATEFEPYWPNCMGTELPTHHGMKLAEEQSHM